MSRAEEQAALEKGTCRSCKKPILWVVMASGKRMPLDPTPQTLITIELVGGGRGYVKDAYTSHFATCEFAAQHRKAGKGG